MECSDRQARMDSMGNLDLGRVVEAHVDGHCTAVMWEPGDGCRFVVIIQTLPEKVMKMLCGTAEHVFVSWNDGWKVRSRVLVDGGLHTVDYIAEKFFLHPDSSEAHFLAAIVNLLAGDFTIGRFIFNEAKKKWMRCVRTGD